MVLARQGRALRGDEQDIVKRITVESAHDAEIVGQSLASSLAECVERPTVAGPKRLEERGSAGAQIGPSGKSRRRPLLLW